MIKVMILSNSHKFYSTVRQFSSVPSAIKRIMRKAYAKHGRWNPTEMWVQLDNGKWTKQTIEAFTK